MSKRLRSDLHIGLAMGNMVKVESYFVILGLKL